MTGRIVTQDDLVAGSNVTLSRAREEITINANWGDPIVCTDIITRSPEIDGRSFLPTGFVKDGSVDYSAYFQNAINAIPNTATTPRVLYVPSGVWWAEGISLANVYPIKIVGDGRSSTYFRSKTTTGTVFSIEMDSPVIMRDFTIDTTATKVSGAGIQMDGYSGSTTNGYSEFSNLNVINQYLGLYFVDAHNFHVSNCHFFDSVHTGISVNNSVNGDEGDSLIDGNCVFASASALGAAIAYHSSGGLKVIGNKFLDHNIAIDLNWTSGANSGILIVEGNSIEDQGTYGILMRRTAGACAFVFVLINGNEIAGSHDSDIAQSDSGWISNVNITNNILGRAVGNNTGGGIYLQNVTDGLIQGNDFLNFGTGEMTAINLASGNVRVDIGPNKMHLVGPASGTIKPIVNASTTTTMFHIGSGGMTFAQIAAEAANGSILFLSDGNPGPPVAGSSTGCFAKRINGAWVGD
jgi:hypothetical protein